MVQQFCDISNVKLYLEYQLLPRIVMILVRSFEIDPTFINYKWIISEFSVLLTN